MSAGLINLISLHFSLNSTHSDVPTFTLVTVRQIYFRIGKEYMKWFEKEFGQEWGC